MAAEKERGQDLERERGRERESQLTNGSEAGMGTNGYKKRASQS